MVLARESLLSEICNWITSTLQENRPGVRADSLYARAKKARDLTKDGRSIGTVMFGRAVRDLMAGGAIDLDINDILVYREADTKTPPTVPKIEDKSGRYSRLEKDRGESRRREAARDRYRVLFASSFRRLAGTTQVASPHELGVLHNRLTHTLEVAQIARKFAERLPYDYQSNKRTLRLIAEQVDPDVVEVAALAHDLGHPPFGHIGEQELDKCVKRAGVADGYEGNAQTFRIVTKLAARTRNGHGLNLTRASLNAILKYPWRRDKDAPDGAYRKKKFACYETDAEEYESARACLPEGSKEVQTVEASIMDWSDDIAYAIHDLYDFYRCGMIPLELLSGQKEQFTRFAHLAIAAWRTEDRPIPTLDDSRLDDIFHGLLQLFPTSDRFEPRRRQRGELRSFMNVLINRYVRSDIVKVEEKQDGMLGLHIVPELRFEIELLKFMTRHFVIDHPALGTVQEGQRRVVRELFATFLKAAKTGRTHVLPVGVTEVLEGQIDDFAMPKQDNGQTVRAVADAISSMTEAQAYAMRDRIVGRSGESITQTILT